MKKYLRILLLALAIFALVFALAACGGSSDDDDTDEGVTENPNPDDDNDPDKDPDEVPDKDPDEGTEEKPDPLKPIKDACQKLNGFVGKKYATVDLSIVTVSGNTSLTSTFSFKSDNTVSYVVEKIASFKVEDNGNIIIPTDSKEIIEGTASVSATGNTVNVDGTFIEIPSYSELKGSFNFDYSNLKNYKIDAGKVSFDVIDASKFLGLEETVDFTNMAVEVLFTDTNLSSVKVACKSGNTSLTYNYTFGAPIN